MERTTVMKTPKEFDYDLWTEEEEKYIARSPLRTCSKQDWTGSYHKIEESLCGEAPHKDSSNLQTILLLELPAYQQS